MSYTTPTKPEWRIRIERGENGKIVARFLRYFASHVMPGEIEVFEMPEALLEPGSKVMPEDGQFPPYTTFPLTELAAEELQHDLYRIATSNPRTATQLMIESERAGAIETVRQALEGAERFLRNRDMMNAAVHNQEVRWSPLTEMVARALCLCNPTWRP